MLLFIAVVSAINVCAQSSQKKVLLQQIAALKVYGNYVHKGYSIAKKGLNTISDLKEGEFNLHSVFFTALKTVSPTIRNYEKVAGILALQLKIMKQSDAISGLLYDDLYLGDEREYVQRVLGRLLEDCDANLEVLLEVLSDTTLEMDDADRMTRIDTLYSQMLDNYTFSKSFGDETTILLKSRQQEQRDIQTGRVLRQLNPQP